MEEVLQIRKDIRYVARPISFGHEETKEMDKLSTLVLAAGLQGKFWEFHKAFLEYPEQNIPDSWSRNVHEKNEYRKTAKGKKPNEAKAVSEKETDFVSYKLASGKVISSEGLPEGIEVETLQKILATLEDKANLQ